MKSNALSVQFQWLTFSITSFIIILLVAGQLKKFCTVDQPPRIFSVTPQTVKQFVITPAKVDVGLTITDFPVFNVADNTFQMSAIIWFTFDPALISLATVENFSFVKGKIDYKSEPTTRLDGDLITAQYTIRVTFRTDLYYGFFPFEDHTLHLMLANTNVNPDEFMYVSSYANVIIDQAYITGWEYADHNVKTGYTTTPLGKGRKSKDVAYPAVLFSFDFFHHSARYAISVLLPLLIIFFIDLLSLCLDQKKKYETLVTLSTGNIVALVAYRFVIESMTPRVGYPTIADYLYFLFLTNTFIIFVINCVGPYLTVFMKKIISVTLQLGIIGVIVYLLAYWIPC